MVTLLLNSQQDLFIPSPVKVQFQCYGLSQVLWYVQKMETADLRLQLLYVLTDYKNT